MPPASPSTSEERAEELVERVLGRPAYIDIVVPRTTVRAKMRLPKRSERFQANADARRALADGGFPIDASAAAALGAGEQWHYELGARLLAVCVRDPQDPDGQPLATLEEWRECDDDQLDALWERFQDLEAELNPMDAGTLSPADAIAIEAAAKKKDAGSLMSFGSRRLALFAITSTSQPASSTTSES